MTVELSLSDISIINNTLKDLKINDTKTLLDKFNLIIDEYKQIHDRNEAISDEEDEEDDTKLLIVLNPYNDKIYMYNCDEILKNMMLHKMQLISHHSILTINVTQLTASFRLSNSQITPLMNMFIIEFGKKSTPYYTKSYNGYYDVQKYDAYSFNCNAYVVKSALDTLRLNDFSEITSYGGNACYNKEPYQINKLYDINDSKYNGNIITRLAHVYYQPNGKMNMI